MEHIKPVTVKACADIYYLRTACSRVDEKES